MGIRTSRQIALGPFVLLSRRQVIETDRGFRHFIEHNVEPRAVCKPPIVKFDPERDNDASFPRY